LFSDEGYGGTGRKDFLNRDPAVEGERLCRVPYKGWKNIKVEEYTK
jgi:hypothetical protein